MWMFKALQSHALYCPRTFPRIRICLKKLFICCLWNQYMVILQSLQYSKWTFGFNLKFIIVFLQIWATWNFLPLTEEGFYCLPPSLIHELVLVPELKRPQSPHSSFFFSIYNYLTGWYLMKYISFEIKISEVNTEVSRTALLLNLFSFFQI